MTKRGASSRGGITRAFEQALSRHRAGDLEAAAAGYDRVIARAPRHAGAWAMKGVLALQRGRADEAVPLFVRSIALDGSAAGTFVNLGNAHRALGDPTASIAAYRRALALEPRLAIAHNNLGNALRDLGALAEAADSFARAAEIDPSSFAAASNLAHVLVRLGRATQECRRFVHRALAVSASASASDVANLHNTEGNLFVVDERFEDAIASYRRATEIDPSFVEAHLNLARVLARELRIEETIAPLRAALRLRPTDLTTYPLLALALRRLRRGAEATEVYAAWQSLDPHDPIATHMAQTGGLGVPPERATASYVRREFDSFAATFDDVLVSKLGYRAPTLVVSALERSRPPKPLQVLDAGCGTGLCGPLLKPFAHRLTGVDLSPRMLEKARQRGVYDELLERDLTELVGAGLGELDAIVAADVMLYFGRLEPVLRAFRSVLSSNGLVVFTVETVEGAERTANGWALGEGGRFVHDAAYVARALAESGFESCEVVEEVLRCELGAEVRGLVVTARAVDGTSRS